jgi:seryl-tRNA synthetase
MHDIRALLADPEANAAKLRRRGYELDVELLAKQDAARRSLITAIDALRERSKVISREIGDLARSTDPADRERAEALKVESRQSRELIKQHEAELEEVECQLREHVLLIPNIPADHAPEGLDETGNQEISRWGSPPTFTFDVVDHADLAERAGILDLKRAAKISGSRFAVMRGAGAALERALVNFLADLHIREHHYTEVSVPFLVTPEAMTGTGQLPKFEEDLFSVSGSDRKLFLIPTAEVPVTNLHADEILRADELPIAYCCYSACFRAEAGAYGIDTRGIIRQHQFHKFELVRICRPEDAWDQLELLRSHAEAALARLGLHYRVVALAAGDLGFAATFCYDLEVWVPSQQRYRELSSCSNCGTFQARRAGIRYRPSPQARPEYCATLNGSALPIGRTVVAILEQYQRADGSVDVPEALRPYTGFSRIRSSGETDVVE